jgi:hypothetical protein
MWYIECGSMYTQGYHLIFILKYIYIYANLYKLNIDILIQIEGVQLIRIVFK